VCWEINPTKSGRDMLLEIKEGGIGPAERERSRGELLREKGTL